MARPWVPAVAALLAFNLPAHIFYFGWKPPGRTGWWLLWAGLTALLHPVVKRVGPLVVGRLQAAGPMAVALPLAAGVAVAGWWHGVVLDVLWLHGAGGRAALLPVLFLAHVTFGAVVAGGLLAALIATDGPPSLTRERGTPVAPGGMSSRARASGWVALFVLAAGLFAYGWVSQERIVYGFDAMYYWDRAAGWAERLRADPLAGADEFRRSVQTDGYTLLPVLPHALAMAAFGDHRRVYVLTTATVYLPLVVLGVAAVVRRASPGRGAVAPAVLLVGLLPVAWEPVLGGYPDVGGVALAAASLALYLSAPPGGLRWPTLVALAAVLVGLVLFRRWYAFWVVAFGLMTGVDALVAAVRAGSRAGVVRCLRQPVAVGVLLAAGLVLVAEPGVRQMVGGDFAGAFAAYKTEAPFSARVLALVRLIGAPYVALAGVSAVALLATPTGRRPTLFIAGMVPVMVAHFLRVQDFNAHHLYLLLPALAVLPAAALARLPWWALPPAAVGVLLLFVPAVPAPQQRGDLDEFRRLADFLNARPADEPFLVLSSSPDLHGSMLASLGRSLRVPVAATGRQLGAEDVDRVSGFPAGVFRAGLVLVADPPQTHLRPAEQQVVLLPAGDLLTGTGIAAGFDRLPDMFHYDGGVTLRVFRRVRPIPPAVFTGFVERLRTAHPDVPRVFTPPPDLPP